MPNDDRDVLTTNYLSWELLEEEEYSYTEKDEETVRYPENYC